MNSNFKKILKVQKNTVQLSDEIQIGLANNEEYDNMTDKLCIAIYNYFIECNPSVSIEIPKKRIKSPKGIHEKSVSREIERLSKLYAIEDLQEDEVEELYQLIKDRIQEKEQINEEEILENVKILLQQDIEKLDIQVFLNNIMVEQISASTQKALLRILAGKIENSDKKDKNYILKNIDEKYGKKAAEISGKPEDDKIKYETVELIKKDNNRKELLYDKIGYLKSEDLVGTKIVISDTRYNHQQMNTMGKKFVDRMIKDKNFLEENRIEVIPFSLKHKNKTNGYEAEHIKFRFKDMPEYTLELQLKTEYVENLCRTNGSASHEERPGKERVLPSLDNKEQFKKEIQYRVPRYTLFYKENGKYKISKKCSMKENIIGYYESLIDVEDYEKINELLEKTK